MRRMIREDVSMVADKAGKETFEESQDFDVGDDFDPKTAYEEASDNAELIAQGAELTPPTTTSEEPPEPAKLASKEEKPEPVPESKSAEKAA